MTDTGSEHGSARDADPYPDDRAYLDDELVRLDSRLRIEVDRFEGPVDEFGALYVSREEVERLLGMDGSDPTDRADTGVAGTGGPSATERAASPGPEASRADVTETARLESLTERIGERRRATREAGQPLRFDRLLERFGVGPVGREALVLALAPDLDARYATVYAYLQDDATQRRPSVGFLTGLLSADVGALPDADPDRLDARAAFAPGSPLVEADLIRFEGPGPLPTQTVQVDDRVVAVLLGEDDPETAFGDVVSLATPETSVADLAVDADRATALADLAGGAADGSPLIALHGPTGAGKRAQVEAVCAGRDLPVLTVAADRVAPADLPGLVADVVREARIQGAAVHVSGLPDEDEEAAETVRRLDDLDGPAFVTTEAAPPKAVRAAPDDHQFVPLSVAPADYEQRRRHWAGFDDLPAGVDPGALASKFSLTRGEIDDAMTLARGAARATGATLSAADVYEACRAQSSEQLADLAVRVEPTYGWDDIVLPPEQTRRLREVAARIADQGTVYEDWQFAEASSLGNGLVALFSGPSGTGKTMAAEVVAADAGLDLYKVDLSAVVSKYVGETESNLGRIFDEAADSDAILLFDEADALFGERSEVSDARDRYANVEVNYLLQRVEEHDGAVLLTSNLEANIDDAFRRRIHVGIEFPFPDRQARETIWRTAFPEAAPVGDLDYGFLAALELTGGNIRNVALTAAFLAADDDTEIGMTQVVRAVKREFQKTGRLVESGRFDEYRHLLEE